MRNIHTEKIEELMQSFKKYDSTQTNNVRLIEFTPPIDPHLLAYIFDKILGFKIVYRPIEKINYFVDYLYKESVGHIIHGKFSCKIHCEHAYEKEINNLLIKVNKEIEKAFLLYSDEAISQNKYSLPNHYYFFTNKLEILRKDIDIINKKINRLSDNFEKEKKNILKYGVKKVEKKSKNGKFTIIENSLTNSWTKYMNNKNELLTKLSYLIETYIDNCFSFLEHFLSLLYPMLDDYDETIPYTKFIIKDWRSKLECLLNYNVDYKQYIEYLSEAKETYRNRLAHGLFSREKQVNIKIDGFGLYPLWIGKKYCRGFNGAKELLDYNDFQDFYKLFQDLLKQIENDFPLQFNIIQSSMSIYLERSLFKKAFDSKEENQKFIEYFWYMQDALTNMDW